MDSFLTRQLQPPTQLATLVAAADKGDDKWGIIKAACIEGPECHPVLLSDLPSFIKVAGLKEAAKYLSSLIPSSVTLSAAMSALKNNPKETLFLLQTLLDMGYRILAKEVNMYGKAVEVTLMRFLC